MNDFPYPHCRTCVNRELDPYQCETCDYGSNYEPYDDEDDEFDDALTIEDLRDLLLMQEAA